MTAATGVLKDFLQCYFYIRIDVTLEPSYISNPSCAVALFGSSRSSKAQKSFDFTLKKDLLTVCKKTRTLNRVCKQRSSGTKLNA